MSSKIRTITIQSADMQLNANLKCTGNQTFSEIEANLYKLYPQYKETNNIFLCKGSVVKRFKTIDENGIKNGDIILLMPSGE